LTPTQIRTQILKARETVAEDNKRVQSVSISGAAGPCASLINGLFDPTAEIHEDRVRYCKRGDASMCMELFQGQWHVKHVSVKGTGGGFASYAAAYVVGGCAAEACTSDLWILWDGENLRGDPSVKMVLESEVSSCCMQFFSFSHRPLLLAALSLTDA
jgi:hypothetical protein